MVHKLQHFLRRTHLDICTFLWFQTLLHCCLRLVIEYCMTITNKKSKTHVPYLKRLEDEAHMKPLGYNDLPCANFIRPIVIRIIR